MYTLPKCERMKPSASSWQITVITLRVDNGLITRWIMGLKNYLLRNENQPRTQGRKADGQDKRTKIHQKKIKTIGNEAEKGKDFVTMGI